MLETHSVYNYKDDIHSSHNEISNWIIELGVKKVLDIGCAGGFVSLALGNKWKGELIGIEIDTSWLNSDRLKKYKKIYWLNLDHKYLSKELVKKHKNFEAIVAADVLEHLENPSKNLQDIKKVLNPNGYLMISLPNANYLPVFIIRLLFPKFRMSKGPLDRTHKHFYSLGTSKNFLDSNNFRLISLKTTPPPIGLIFKKYSNSFFVKTIYNINYSLSKLLPNIFAYQLLFLVQPRK